MTAPGIRGTTDPLLGGGGAFAIPRADAAPIVATVPRLVRTRGAAYAFLPSISALHDLDAFAETA